MVIVRRLLLLAVFIAVLVLGWQLADANADVVRVDYLLGQFEAVKVWVLVAGTFAVGALVGVAVCAIELARLGLLSRRYRKALSRLEAELHGLRSLPLAPGGGARLGAEPPESTAAGRPGRST
jgi:uncharacterized membrane protein YciS (DUF1049 family)